MIYVYAILFLATTDQKRRRSRANEAIPPRPLARAFRRLMRNYGR